MACYALVDRQRGCLRTPGGIRRLYIRPFVDSNYDNAPTYSVFELKKGTTEGGSRIEAERIGGASFMHFLSLQLHDVEETDKSNIMALVLSDALQIVAENNNGKLMLLGKNTGLSSVSSDGFTTGMVKTDASVYMIELEAEEPETVEFITWSTPPA